MASKTVSEQSKKQQQAFVDAARELGCDESEERFDAALRVIGRQQPQHWSDCAVYNEPALPAGPCDCGGFKPDKK